MSRQSAAAGAAIAEGLKNCGGSASASGASASGASASGKGSHPCYADHYKEDGTCHDSAPHWAKYLQDMKAEFPSPFKSQDGDDKLVDQVSSFLQKMDNLRPSEGGPAFLGDDPRLKYKLPDVKQVKIPQQQGDVETVIDGVIEMFNGLGYYGSPLTMCNVNPQSNNAAIIASMLADVFCPNYLEGEYSWNVHRAELESGGMLANLVGWDPLKAGCIYTYGGSACWLYGLKYGLTRVLPDSRKKGVRVEAKVLVSQEAHYCQQNATDWSGLGTDNVIRIKTDIDTDEMDLNDLERVLKESQASKIPIAAVVCTMGTTDANCFDPLAKVRKMLDKYPNPPGFGKAILHADAVIGWAWIYFKDYDFVKNPLGFSERILPILRHNGQRLSELIHADCIGIDFHKMGFSPYPSSCFLYKNAEEFEHMLKRGADPYLQPRTPYNPMYYTLEVSRTSSGALGGWATLKYFGMEGMHAIMGGILESKYYLFDLTQKEEDMVCVNGGDTSLVTLFRVYPSGTDAKKQYKNEYTHASFRDDLIKHNHFTQAVGDKLFEWFRSGKKLEGKYTPWTSYTKGFCVTAYNRDEKDKDAMVFALKAFPMNPNITPAIMQWVVHCVKAARDEVVKEGKPKAG